MKRRCWLNEISRSHTRTLESSDSSSSKEPATTSNEDQASGADLQIVLAGMPFPPPIRDSPQSSRSSERQVPTSQRTSRSASSASRPHWASGGQLTVHEGDDPRATPNIRPGRDFGYDGSGEAKGNLSFDATSTSADLNTAMLEEVCRRGGVLDLPGMVWNGPARLSIPVPVTRSVQACRLA